jgi:ATP/maltotriose-dependent transcriptional regulator MalT
MITSPDLLFQSIPSNKFYPPRINYAHSIERHTLITRHLADELPSRLFIVIEAQAGQGKTTLVQQFLERSPFPSIWYQIGPEDNNPLLLLLALRHALSRTYPGLRSTRLNTVLENRQISTDALKRGVNILLNDIDALLEEDTFIVFDDLHLLDDTQQGRQVLDYLIDTSPPLLHFVLTSRHPLHLGSRSLRNSPHLIYLDSDDLALSPAEIEVLYDRLLDTTISRTEAVEIFSITNGWIMGIILAAHPFAHKNGTGWQKNRQHGKPQLFKNGTNNVLLTYFEEEIFNHIPEPVREPLQILSFLDGIDTHLAEGLAATDNLAHLLGELADRNLFIYRLDDENRLFRFHHLFKEFLQMSGKKSLGAAAVSHIYQHAATAYLEQGRPDKALKTMLISGDYTAMEQLLYRHGPHLLATGQARTVLSILQNIPRERLSTHPWLGFYCGLLAFDVSPLQTLPLFTSCRERFAESGNEEGELMALTQIIQYHFAISGLHRDGAALLNRTIDLFARNNTRLPEETTLLAARSLAAGLSLFTGSIATARHYARRGLELATTHSSNTFIAALRFISGYIELLCGDRRAARLEIEKSFSLCSDPAVGTNNRLSLIFLHLFELSQHGDLSAFLRTRDMIETDFDRVIVHQTMMAPYITLWSAIVMIANGRITVAHELLDNGLQDGQTIANSHMAGQFLQWRAFIQALLGDETAALDDLKEAQRQREIAGGAFHSVYQLAIGGATLALLKRYDEAAQALSMAEHLGSSMPAVGVTVCCRAYQALIALATGNRADSATYLASWLTTMNCHGYSCFWGWEPTTMARLLRAALQTGIEPVTARRLARRRLASAIDDAGELIPILSIHILGSFSLTCNERLLVGPHDLTNRQRELFELIIASPGQRISQEQVQLAFWPDSPPDKARKSFDTLMTRLRKTLSQKLPVPVKNYIGVEKGYVHLTRVAIDADHFLQLARRGLKRAKQGYWWQAGNLFTKALAQWTSFRPIDFFASEQTIIFGDELISTLRSVCLTWSHNLIVHNRAEEAIDLLETTKNILPIDEELMFLRYQLFLTTRQPLRAREITSTYYHELLQLGWSPEEAEELVFSLTNRTWPVQRNSGE